MNINEEIQKLTDKAISEKLPIMIEKSVEKMLNSIVEDMFCTYGELSKGIKKKISEKLDVSLDKFDLIEYNGLIAQTINDQLLETIDLTPIKELTKETVGFMNKKEIKLSEIVEMFKEEAMSDDYENNYEGEITIHVVEYRDKWTSVYLDSEKGKDVNQCSIQLQVKDNEIKAYYQKDWFSSKGPITPYKIQRLSTLEKKIFRLYANSVKIEIDANEEDSYWCRED